jgi:hypothetical protein
VQSIPYVRNGWGERTMGSDRQGGTICRAQGGIAQLAARQELPKRADLRETGGMELHPQAVRSTLHEP